jgi:hypothetical protein
MLITVLDIDNIRIAEKTINKKYSTGFINIRTKYEMEQLKEWLS